MERRQLWFAGCAVHEALWWTGGVVIPQENWQNNKKEMLSEGIWKTANVRHEIQVEFSCSLESEESTV